MAAARSEMGAGDAVPTDDARSGGLARLTRSAGGALVLPGPLVAVGGETTGETDCGGAVGRVVWSGRGVATGADCDGPTGVAGSGVGALGRWLASVVCAKVPASVLGGTAAGDAVVTALEVTVSVGEFAWASGRGVCVEGGAVARGLVVLGVAVSGVVAASTRWPGAGAAWSTLGGELSTLDWFWMLGCEPD
ncbi:hypothetical protein [Nocardia amamiensis]|uniref:hypothetical protein n=1 Tax=Nocardia amamiensis TaxID=404578 RepID=UPI001C3FF051|nr:hypothetical protein [Nocardia amamiensis]